MFAIAMFKPKESKRLNIKIVSTIGLHLPFPEREMSGGLVESVRCHTISLSQQSLFGPHM